MELELEWELEYECELEYKWEHFPDKLGADFLSKTYSGRVYLELV